MRFNAFSFGSIRIDGTTYEHDVVIDRGQVRKRKKKPSKRFHDAFGHTPLSIEEEIPWKCRRLVVGTGTGALPIMEDVFYGRLVPDDRGAYQHALVHSQRSNLTERKRDSLRPIQRGANHHV